jgi:hypothetical protein
LRRPRMVSARFGLRPRVRLVEHFHQVADRRVRVFLRGGKQAVPQQLLDGAHVGAFRLQLSGAGGGTRGGLWDDDQSRTLISSPGILDVGQGNPFRFDPQFATGAVGHDLLKGIDEDLTSWDSGSPQDRQRRAA